MTELPQYPEEMIRLQAGALRALLAELDLQAEPEQVLQTDRLVRSAEIPEKASPQEPIEVRVATAVPASTQAEALAQDVRPVTEQAQADPQQEQVLADRPSLVMDPATDPEMDSVMEPEEATARADVPSQVPEPVPVQAALAEQLQSQIPSPSRRKAAHVMIAAKRTPDVRRRQISSIVWKERLLARTPVSPRMAQRLSSL